MLLKGQGVTIEGNNLYTTITDRGLVLEIDHDRNNKEFYSIETVAIIGKGKAPFDLDPYSNLNVNAILI